MNIDSHRRFAVARNEQVTLTAMYHVVERLRANQLLTDSQRAVHEIAACGILRDMHDDLDRLVAKAYGWPWPMPDAEILDRLVALHDERVAEEAQGIVRWLRPEYQSPGATASEMPAELALAAGTPTATAAAETPAAWPAQAIEQISALKRLGVVATISVDDAVRHFSGARADIVARHLETLAILGELRVVEPGRYAAA